MGSVVYHENASSRKLDFLISCVLFASAVGLLTWGIGAGSVFNGDDATYALIAREMREGGDLLHLRLDGTVLHQRPPLYPWLLALSTSLLGETIFALRLPAVLMAAGTCVLVVRLGRLFLSPVTAIIAGALFPTLALEFLYARAVVSDTTLAFLVTLTIYLLVRSLEKPPALWGAAVALGLALMTKQVVSLLPLVALVAAWLVRGRAGLPSGKRLAMAGTLALAIAAPWHVTMLLIHGRDFLSGYLGFNVIARATSSVLAPTSPAYYLQVLWSKEGPIALLALAGIPVLIARAALRRSATDALVPLWFGVVFIGFSLASSRIDYYLLPAYPALVLLLCAPLELVGRVPVVNAVLGIALVAASAGTHLPKRLKAVDPSGEIKQLAETVASVSRPEDPLFVVDELHFAARFYSRRPTMPVVTRKPNYQRLMGIELFREPGNMLYVPASEVGARLAKLPRYFAIQPMSDLERAPPPSDSILVARTSRYVLYTNVPTHHSGANVVISVVGTNDLHGHVESLPILSGFVQQLRRLRSRDGGVVLVDAGDMFQGTLESNLGEGTAVVRAYNALGYDAVAVGNHEFDFGPLGDAVTPRAPGDDPRGALKARANEAKFPFLLANVFDAAGRKLDWPNVRSRTQLEIRGIKVGIVGATTEAMPRTTIRGNVSDLRVASLGASIETEARALRGEGAAVVVLTVHEGGTCKTLDNPEDLSSCDRSQEIMAVAESLPKGLVDVIVAGHTHQGMAHVVAGIPVIESFANGRAFGRVDLEVDPKSKQVVRKKVHAPRFLCAGDAPGGAPRKDAAACTAGTYEGADIVADEKLRALLAPDFERARTLKEQKLGVHLETTVRRAYEEESALGNFFADLMLFLHPGADVAMTNGGGLRADLPAGDLTYGHLFEALPFDNRFATVRMRGKDLKKILLANLSRRGGIFSVAGIHAKARCVNGQLEVELARKGGRPLADDAELTLMTSDFLATGGDSALSSLNLPEGSIVLDEGLTIRDAIADLLRARGGTIREKEHFDPAKRRLVFPGPRPVACGAGNGRASFRDGPHRR
ncbi:MAG: 5'-nucleotidase C-terminal domain-containing protein [Deltaproteobacteria bacterium]|nr:5'-nucleotidase C-terminal domain-containing protein [Deltaproteobacteria bacterium]